VAGTVEGSIVEIAADGALISDVTASQLVDAPRDESVTICCDEHETHGIYEVENDHPEATFIAVLDGAGRLTLQIIGMNASELLGIRVGESVSVRW
jgi:hypothetical protein